jgi:hypothetical protein
MRAVRPIRTRLTGTLAALVLGATLSGCGSDDPQAGEGPTPVADPSSSTVAEPSDSPTAEDPEKVDEGSQVDVARFARRLRAGIARTHYAHLDFTMSGAGGEMTGAGDVDYTAKPPNMEMSMEIGPQTVGMLLVDRVMYVQSSQLGDKYLQYDLGDPANPLGAGLSDQLDPAGSIEAFTRALSSVTSGGKEDLGGRTLDQYVLTVDTSRLADQAAAAGLPAEIQVVVWLDDQDRMAKTSMAMGPIQYDATISDFDTEVELHAPPAGQVVTPPAA